MRVIVALLTIAAIGLPKTLQAADPNPQAGEDAGENPLKKWGIEMSVGDPKKGCVVIVTIDQPTFVSAVPDMVTRQLFNSRVSEATAVVAPDMLIRTAIEVMSPIVTKNVFAGSDSNNRECSFKWVIINPDEYGNDKTIDAVTYGFSKAIYNKVHWERFNGDNFPKIAIKYHINPAFAQQANAESFAAAGTMRSDH